MKLSKAKEILTNELNALNPRYSPATIAAHKLGIEALIRLDYCRSGEFEEPYELLPGETEE